MMSILRLEMRATRQGWMWALHRGPAILASGAAEDGNEGIAAANLAIDEMFDGGLETRMRRPFHAHSRLGGARS